MASAQIVEADPQFLKATPPPSVQGAPSSGLIRLIPLQTIPMPNGVLGVAEVSKHIGFPVHRAYYIKEVPTGESRGGHGHRHLRQCFLCLRGGATLKVTRDGVTETVRLGVGAPMATMVGPGCWRDLSEFSHDSVIIVLASEEYDEADYIREYGDFVRWEADSNAVKAVPYLDLSRLWKEVGPELELAMRSVLKAGALIGGKALTVFEDRFAEYCEAAAAVGVGNGLDALVLALNAWGVGPGDEVITPAHTFIATAQAIELVGATTVLVDVEADTGLMDMSKVADAITERTKAIIPVHLYGQAVDMDALHAAIGGRDIKVLEDACQSHGARYKGRRTGSLGDGAAFSFYPTKNLGALGDGGGFVSNSAETVERVRMLANYGSKVKYRHELAGRNSRLDPIQAAVLDVKLDRLDAWNARRGELALRYFAGLQGIKGLELPAVRPWSEPVWHVFAIRAPGARDQLQAFLAEQGVGTNIHYPIPVHLQPCFAGRWAQGDFPVAEALGNSLLSLPLDPTHSEREIDFVIAKVRAFFGQ